ncbi:MAG: glycine/sarcosine/betaine reductase selenoprotein B family protein [Dehalococcoidia bacterium]
MPSLDQLSEVLRNSLLTLPVPVNDGAPFRPLPRPLAECRLALVSTAGLHLRGDRPFSGGDPSFRDIPAESSANDVLQSHTSISFDRTPALQDLNVIFPMDRLRELAAAGAIGSLAPTFYSFMGAQRDTTHIDCETAPAVAERLLAEQVDAVLLVPV